MNISYHFTGQQVEPECVAELKDMRKSLMEDYKISPDIVTACDLEIKAHCGGGLQREGKTLHCLMDLARPKKRVISSECRGEVSTNTCTPEVYIKLLLFNCGSKHVCKERDKESFLMLTNFLYLKLYGNFLVYAHLQYMIYKNCFVILKDHYRCRHSIINYRGKCINISFHRASLM